MTNKDKDLGGVSPTEVDGASVLSASSVASHDATYEAAWVRRKLGLREDADLGTLQGQLHVTCAHAQGYERYITAYKCNDKQGEIARLTAALRLTRTYDEHRWNCRIEYCRQCDDLRLAMVNERCAALGDETNQIGSEKK